MESRYPEGSLAAAAEAWLARGRTQKLSAATETARRQDLVAITARLAGRLDRPVPAVAVDAFGAELGRLHPDDLTEGALAEAIADYAATHAAASVRRLLSTWRGFARDLVHTGALAANPLERIDGPKRPEWLPKAFEFDDLNRPEFSGGSGALVLTPRRAEMPDGTRLRLRRACGRSVLHGSVLR